MLGVRLHDGAQRRRRFTHDAARAPLWRGEDTTVTMTTARLTVLLLQRGPRDVPLSVAHSECVKAARWFLAGLRVHERTTSLVLVLQKAAAGTVSTAGEANLMVNVNRVMRGAAGQEPSPGNSHVTRTLSCRTNLLTREMRGLQARGLYRSQPPGSRHVPAPVVPVWTAEQI